MKIPILLTLLAATLSNTARVLHAGPCDKAREYFDKAIVSNDDDEKISLYKKITEMFPDCCDAYYNLGNIYYRQKRYDDAISAYSSAILVNPAFAIAHNSLGNAYYRLERKEDAIKEYEACLEIDPKYAGARKNLAEALEKVGRYHEARRHWKRYVDLEPDGEYADTARSRINDIEQILTQAIQKLSEKPTSRIKRIYRNGRGEECIEVSLSTSERDVSPGTTGKIYHISDYTETIVAYIAVVNVSENGVIDAVITKKSKTIEVKDSDFIRFLPEAAASAAPVKDLAKEERQEGDYSRTNDRHKKDISDMAVSKDDISKQNYSAGNNSQPENHIQGESAIPDSESEIKNMLIGINEAIRSKNVEGLCWFLNAEDNDFYTKERKIIEDFCDEIHIVHSSFDDFGIKVSENTAEAGYLWNLAFQWKGYGDNEFHNQGRICLTLKKQGETWKICGVVSL